MRNQKWNQFIHRDEEIPETCFQACVFLDHAFRHLRNRIDGPLGETFDILNDANRRASQAIFEDPEKEAA